jgi:dolichol-phosphate mannosyltransferase
MAASQFSIVIAVKNESSNIPPLFAEISDVYLKLRDFGLITDLVVVDDDSTDGSRQAITLKGQDLLAKGMRVKTVFRTGQSGTVSAQIAGAIASDASYIIVMDGDFQHDPKFIGQLVSRIDGNVDVVVASRYMRGGVLNLNLNRALVSNIASLLAHVVIGNSRVCSDPLSGFFICKRDWIIQLHPYGGKNKLLLYILAKYKGLRICEVPFSMGRRASGESKIAQSYAKMMIRYLSELLTYRHVEESILI